MPINLQALNCYKLSSKVTKLVLDSLILAYKLLYTACHLCCEIRNATILASILSHKLVVYKQCLYLQSNLVMYTIIYIITVKP